jgi:hypothetical protein
VTASPWNAGMLEYWNHEASLNCHNNEKPNIPLFHHSNIPVTIQYSGTPMPAEFLIANLLNAQKDYKQEVAIL